MNARALKILAPRKLLLVLPAQAQAQYYYPNTLTGGTNYFTDPQWTNYPGRYYRLIAP